MTLQLEKKARLDSQMTDFAVALPPGPRWKWLSDLRYFRDPTTFHRICRQHFGETFTVNGAEGKVVITTSPDLARQIYAASHDQLGAPVDLTEPALGEGSLFHLDGAASKQSRRLVTSPITSNALRHFVPMIMEVTDRHAARWSANRPLMLRQVMNDLSKEIIIRTVVGTQDQARVDQCATLITQYVASFFSPALFWLSLRNNAIPQWRRFIRAREAIRNHLRSELDRIRKDGPARTSVMSCLIAAESDDGKSVDDEQIIDNILTMLLAGHETTSVGVTWAMYGLERDPETLGTLRRELDQAGRDGWQEDPMGQRQLGAVCREAIRLYPITSRITRKVINQPYRLGSWDVPVGMGVGISITAIHKDPTIYPDPLKFRPKRFLERSYAAHEYMPFGGGIRRCVGAAFAEAQMRLVVAHLVTSFDFEAVSRQPAKPVRRNVIVAPDGDIAMWVKPRS